jgi:hypothetical protein
MKNIIIGFAFAATTLTACNSGDNQNPDNKQIEVKSDTLASKQKQASADTSAMQTATAGNNTAFSTKEIISAYIQLKNALAKDNAKDAATAGNTLVATLGKVDMKSLPQDRMKNYMDIAADLKENAEHIGANAGKIKHQREHFIMMSKDMADLIKTFGNGGQTLYKDFCPMANDGKGAIWISEVKEIKNPYLGSKMPDCGTIKETIK